MPYKVLIQKSNLTPQDVMKECNLTKKIELIIQHGDGSFEVYFAEEPSTAEKDSVKQFLSGRQLKVTNTKEVTKDELRRLKENP